ncbi:hypothetical protein D3C75_569570 [compost metagenome]
MKTGDVIVDHINNIDDALELASEHVKHIKHDEDRYQFDAWNSTMIMSRSISLVALALSEQPRQVRRVRRL